MYTKKELDKTRKLIDKVADLVLLNSKILVSIPKVREYEKEDFELDDEKNKKKNPLKDEMAVKKVTKTIKNNMQVAMVLNVAKDITEVEPGDLVVVDIKAIMDFDYLDNVGIVTKHNILAKKVAN